MYNARFLEGVVSELLNDTLNLIFGWYVFSHRLLRTLNSCAVSWHLNPNS